MFIKTFFTSILFFCYFYFFGQAPSNIKVIKEAKKIDFIGRFSGITTNNYIDISLKNGQLYYETDLDDYTHQWNTAPISFKDNSIQIEGKWYQLAIRIDNQALKSKLGLLNNENFHEEGTRPLRHPQVSFVRLRKGEIINLMPKELKIMRNEIYAKKGYRFKSKEMKSYFSKKDWYIPKVNNVALNEIEKYNIKFIKQIEAEKRKSARILSKKEVNTIFTDDKKTKLGINFPIRKAFICHDKAGSYYLVLTEDNAEEYNQMNSSSNSTLQAFFIKKNTFSLKWKMRDFIVKGVHDKETDISFFTRYFDIKDIDNDGILDPIILYGTWEGDYSDGGRLKILIYYKNKKIAIRHQNCSFDDCRDTKIDKSFYKLPISIQKHVDLMMRDIQNNNHSTFNEFPLTQE